ncbi:MAG: hypothetical protein OHK0039_09320 [Bacteroidia bacterium]
MQKTINQVALKWGLILSAYSVASTVLTYQFSTPGEMSAMSIVLGLLGLAVWVIVPIMAIREFKQSTYGYISLGQGFRIGFFALLISSAIGGIFSYIYAAFINPDLSETLVNATLTQLESNPAVMDSQIEMFEKLYGAMFSPLGLMLNSLIGGAFMGAILALIVAAIMKKDAPIDGGGIEDIGTDR